MTPSIRYLRQKEIDKEKWDDCIRSSAQSMIYAQSLYLDAMARHWDALVYGDYQTVMPLTWNRKWGIRYLYQPPFCQQLGIFSKQEISPALAEAFIQDASAHFPFAEVFLNHSYPGVKFETHPNYILHLNQGYNQIQIQYRDELQRNLRYSKKFQLYYKATADYRKAIALYRNHHASKTPHLSANDFSRFEAMCSKLLEANQLLVREVTDLDGSLLAIGLFLRDDHRIYNLMPVTLGNGRMMKANHFLIDALIREFSGQDILLDFEGSSLPSIARFYMKFGAINQPYYFFRANRLKPPARWFKN